MKDPANYIIVDSAGVEMYCDDRGAPSLDGYLIGGPDRAVKRVRHAADQYEPVQGFHTFCEGAVLIDLRRRVLGLFTIYLSDYADRAALRAVLAETWPGWEIRWAYGGPSDMHRYLGDVGVDDVEESPVALARDESLVWFHPMGPAEIEQDPDFFLVTVAESGRPVQAYATWTEDAGALWLGESLLSRLPESAQVTELIEPPGAGVHFDQTNRTALVWTTTTIDELGPHLLRLWPGWQFEFYDDRYETQVDRCDGRLFVLEPDLLTALDILRERITPDGWYDVLKYYGIELSPSNRTETLAAVARAREGLLGTPHWQGLAQISRPRRHRPAKARASISRQWPA